MAKFFPALSSSHREFIAKQKLFFVATATADSSINISPKGMDSFHIIDDKTIAWLNVTGSGNETAAHIQSNPRMTIMFCAFEGGPMILRLYGNAVMTQHDEKQWDSLYQNFEPLPGARQIFTLNLNRVQTSCGMSIPFFDYVSERDQLNKWADKQGQGKIQQYWLEKNQTSIDGIRISPPGTNQA